MFILCFLYQEKKKQNAASKVESNFFKFAHFGQSALGFPFLKILKKKQKYYHGRQKSFPSTSRKLHF